MAPIDCKRPRRRTHFWLVLCAMPHWPASLPVARADDWQVSRSDFDPRIIGALKAELRRRPEDAALLKRLVGLYRKHKSLDALVQELREQAESERASGWDAFLVAHAERERGRLDDASRWFETARQRVQSGRPGPDSGKLSIAQSDLALKKAPPDLKGAAGHIAKALAEIKAGDARRRPLLRRLADLQGQAGEHAAAEATLRELLQGASGSESLGLRRELAESLAQGGKSKEALAEWQSLAQAQAGDPAKRAEAELRIGELCEATQDDLGALAAYQRGLSGLPNQHALRRELVEHLIALQRKRGELPALIAQLEKERPAASRSFADWELFARLYDERGDSQGAMSAYRQALRKEPHSIDIRRRLIALLERSGATTEVLREYEALIAQTPGDARPYLELAERLERAGQRSSALAWLRRAAARFGGDASLHSALCDLYQRWGENDLALAEAELLVRLDPRDESHILTLGELYWVRGKKEKADEIWRRLLNLFPGRATGQARLADVYAEHSLMTEALDLYQKAVRAEPTNLQIKRGLAQSLERLSRPQDAVAIWEQIYFAASAPSDRPLRLEARQHLAKLLQKETRLLPTLYSWQRRLAAQLSQLVPDRMQPAELVALAVLVADVSLAIGQIGDAEAALRQLQKRVPQGPLLAEVLLALSAIYQQQHKLDEAIAVLKQAALLLPERRRELQAQLADLSLRSYRDEEAVQYARQAGVDAEGELRLGEILERRDDIRGAMASYKRAVELDSRLFRAHMAVARLHLQRGELNEAAASFRDVVRRATQEDLVLDAGRRAIDIHEYLGTLGELWRELSPLAYAPVSSSSVRSTYRKLLLLLYERYALPLQTLARAGDAAALAELRRLGQGSIKPLTETLVDGDNREQRLAVTLLSAMQPTEAALSLLNLAVLGEPDKDTEAQRMRRPGVPAERPSGDGSRSQGPRAIDIDLRVDAVMIVARMISDGDERAGKKPAEPPGSAASAAVLRDGRSVQLLVRLAASKEKQLRMAALYALSRGASRLPPSSARPSTPDAASFASAFESALFDVSAMPALRVLAWLGLGELSATGRSVSPRVRTQSASLLSRYRSNPEAFDSAELPVLAAAIHALGRAGDVSSVPALIEILAAGNDEAQRQAAWALGALADARAYPALVRAVFNKREPVRQTAAQALGLIFASGAPDKTSDPATAKGDKAGSIGGDRSLTKRLPASLLALPAIELEASPLSELDGASLASRAAPATLGTFVDRLLAAAGALPSAAVEPLLRSDLTPLVSALEEALLSHRDIAERTLCDLLGSAENQPGLLHDPRTKTKRTDAEQGPLSLGPLADAVTDPSLQLQLASAILPTLRRVALAQIPQTVAGQKPALTGNLDTSLRKRAVQVIGRVAALPAAELQRDAQRVLWSVAKSEAPELALSAIERSARAVSSASSPALRDELRAVSDEALTRFFASQDRGVRVAAIGSAARLRALDAGLVSDATLRRAADDLDGFVRDQAQALLRAGR